MTNSRIILRLFLLCDASWME